MSVKSRISSLYLHRKQEMKKTVLFYYKASESNYWTGYGVRLCYPVSYRIMPELYLLFWLCWGLNSPLMKNLLSILLVRLTLFVFVEVRLGVCVVQLSFLFSLSLTRNWLPKLSFYNLIVIQGILCCVLWEWELTVLVSYGTELHI